MTEIFERKEGYTPAFLRKSAEATDGKGVDENSLGKERPEREKERFGGEKLKVESQRWRTEGARHRGSEAYEIGGSRTKRPYCIIAWD